MWILVVGAASAAPPADVVDVAEARALVAAGAIVLDARGWVDFLAGHVPGAQRVDWDVGTTGGTFSSRMDTPARAAEAFSALGVDGEKPVLVVGAWDEGWGEEGRIAWDLAWLGHPDVNVLRGGMAAWDGPEEHLPVSARPGRLVPAVRAELRADRPALKAGAFQRVLDVREPDEFAGAMRTGDVRGGHLPGAESAPWRALLVTLPDLGPDERVVTYCTAGVRSAFAWLLLVDAGIDAANYDGSWWEWAREEPVR